MPGRIYSHNLNMQSMRNGGYLMSCNAGLTNLEYKNCCLSQDKPADYSNRGSPAFHTFSIAYFSADCFFCVYNYLAVSIEPKVVIFRYV